jgi:hypothetical protein
MKRTKREASIQGLSFANASLSKIYLGAAGFGVVLGRGRVAEGAAGGGAATPEEAL